MAPAVSHWASFLATNTGELIQATPKMRPQAYHAHSSAMPNATCQRKVLRCMHPPRPSVTRAGSTSRASSPKLLALENILLRLLGEIGIYRLVVGDGELRLGAEEIGLERLLVLLGREHRRLRKALQMRGVSRGERRFIELGEVSAGETASLGRGIAGKFDPARERTHHGQQRRTLFLDRFPAGDQPQIDETVELRHFANDAADCDPPQTLLLGLVGRRRA